MLSTFRSRRVEAQLGMSPQRAAGTVYGFTVARSTGDFTEQSRALMDALRPHLTAAWRRIQLQEQLDAVSQLLHQATEREDLAVLAVNCSGHITAAERGLIDALQRRIGPLAAGHRLPHRMAELQSMADASRHGTAPTHPWDHDDRPLRPHGYAGLSFATPDRWDSYPH